MRKKGVLILILLATVLFAISSTQSKDDITGEVTGEAITGEASSQETTVSIYVSPSNVDPILGTFNSTALTCEGSVFEYKFNATDTNNDTLTLSISPEDPFFIAYPQSFSGQPTINSSIISGVLKKANAGGIDGGSGSYIETVTIDDNLNATCCTDSETINITVIEINNAPAMTNIGVQTIWTQGDNSTFYKEVVTIDTEDGNQTQGVLNFNISFSNTTLFNISSFGIINYTPVASEIGIHNVTICVNDTGIDNPHINISDICGQNGEVRNTCQNFSLTVTNSNRAPNITSFSPANLAVTTLGSNTVNFQVTKYDPDGTTPDTYWYVNGIFQELDSGSSTDSYSHNFGCGVSGNKTVKADITDGALNDSVEWGVNVTLVSCFTTGVTGGGSSGGGGGTTTQNKDFSINRENINVILTQGESTIEDFVITNHKSTNLSFTLGIADLQKFATLSETEFELPPGETKRIIIEFNTEFNTIPELYMGKILVNGGGIFKQIPTSLEVKSIDPLFDIEISLLEESFPVIPGGELITNVSIFNLGDLGNYELKIEYIIRDEQANEILLEPELRTITTNKINFIKTILLPEEINLGKHVLYARVVYGNKVGSSSVWFSPEQEPIIKSRKLFFLVIGIVLLIFIMAIILIWKKSREWKQVQQKY